MKRLYILILIFTTSATHIPAQVMLDKSKWNLTFYETFNDLNIDDWLYHGDTMTATDKPWVLGETMQEGAKLDLVRNACHSDNRPDNPALAITADLRELQPLDDRITFRVNKLADTAEPWAISQISTTHSDFPELGGKAGYMYGMFEVRCKLPKSMYSYSAFWLSGTCWPPEIDAFECAVENDIKDENGEMFKPFNMFFSTYHWIAGDTGGHSDYYIYRGKKDLYTDFHTWTIVWTPTEITWFFDGRRLKSETDINHIPHINGYVNDGIVKNFFFWTKMHVILGQGLGCPNTEDSSITFAPLIVDYVKIYRPNGYKPFSPSTFSGYKAYYDFLKELYSPANASYQTKQNWKKRLLHPNHIRNFAMQ